MRFIKYLNLGKPKSAASHSETLKIFSQLARTQALDIDEELLKIFFEWMAFRHVATKIYGFLIDEGKLAVITTHIKNEHDKIVVLFEQLLVKTS